MHTILFAWLPLLIAVLLLLRGSAALLGPNPRHSHDVRGENTFFDRNVGSKRRMTGLILGVAAAMSLVLLMSVLALQIDWLPPKWLVYGAVVLGGAFFAFSYLMLLPQSIRPWPVRAVVGVCIVAAAASWWFWPGWLTVDLLAIVLLFGGLSSYLRITLNFKAVATIAGGLFIYDIINVYFTGMMMRAATKTIDMKLPTLVVVPESLALDARPAVALGLGDIIFPGLLIMIAAVLAYRYNAKSVLYGGLVGYAAGMIAVFGILHATQHTQPALITLYPAVMIGILFTARRAGLTHELFSLRHQPGKTPDEESKTEPLGARR